MEEEENDGIDVDSIAACKEDPLILYHAMFGHDPTESYASTSLNLAGDSHTVEHLSRSRCGRNA